MLSRRRCHAGALALLSGPLLRPTASAQSTPSAEPPALDAERLRRGGLVLFIRTGQTDNSRTDDLVPGDFQDCRRQRPLSPEGVNQARRLGAWLRSEGCRLHEVVSSPLCRARESAALLGAATPVIDPDLAYLPYMRRAQRDAARARLRHWLSAAVAARQLRAVVAHGGNLADLTGLYPEEAVLHAFVPQGPAGYQLLGTLAVRDWPERRP